MRIIILFLLALFSMPAFASWIYGKTYVTYEEAAKYVSIYISDGSTDQYYIQKYWNGGYPRYEYKLYSAPQDNVDPTPNDEVVFNKVYTDAECQAAYSGSFYLKEAGDSTGGACAVTATGSETCWDGSDGNTYCHATYEATSTGKINDPSGESTLSESTSDLSEFLTPVESCPAYNCVTIDGQMYNVNFDKLAADSHVTEFNAGDGDTIEFYAGGGNKLTHADGSYEITDSTGKVTKYNSDGSVNNDTSEPDSSDGGGTGGDTGGDTGTGGTDGGGGGSGDSGGDGSGSGDTGGDGTGEGDGSGEEDGTGSGAWAGTGEIKKFDPDGTKGPALIAAAQEKLDLAIDEIRDEMASINVSASAGGSCPTFGFNFHGVGALDVCDKLASWGPSVRAAVLALGALLSFGIIMRAND